MKISVLIVSSWTMLVSVVCANSNVMLDSAAKQGDVSSSNATSGGLEGAASGGQYYYDKLRYKSDKVYSSYGPSEYSSAYVTQSCYGQTPGMFGNAAYDCKSFSVCQDDGRLDIMDCPAYLKFNNYLGVCDWPYKIDAYCNPIYKEEEYSSYYGRSSYGSVEGKIYDKPVYGKPAYEKPAYVAPVYNSYSAPKSYGYSNQYEYPASSYYPSSYAAPSYQNYYKKY